MYQLQRLLGKQGVDSVNTLIDCAHDTIEQVINNVINDFEEFQIEDLDGAPKEELTKAYVAHIDEIRKKYLI